MVDLDTITAGLAAKGDKAAFKKLYDHYSPFVWRVIFKSANGDRETAAEIVQDTFVNIHASLKKFSGESSLGTWIYRVAFNAAAARLAKQAEFRRRNLPLPEDLPDGRHAADAYEIKDSVNRILKTLSAEDRFLLVAKEVDGFTFEQLSDITGKSSESLRTKMFRIRESVKSKTAPKNIREGVLI